MAFAADVFLLAHDGFRADRMLLPPPAVGTGRPKPDPAWFVRARTHALVESLEASRHRVRGATARTVLLHWVGSGAARLHRRQAELVAFLASEEGRSLSFREYVRLHAGRRAPSLRTLQRDWQVLRERGLLEDVGDRSTLRLDALCFG